VLGTPIYQNQLSIINYQLKRLPVKNKLLKKIQRPRPFRFTPHRPHFTSFPQTATKTETAILAATPANFYNFSPTNAGGGAPSSAVGAGLCACPVSLKKPFQDAADGSAHDKDPT